MIWNQCNVCDRHARSAGGRTISFSKTFSLDRVIFSSRKPPPPLDACPLWSLPMFSPTSSSSLGRTFSFYSIFSPFLTPASHGEELPTRPPIYLAHRYLRCVGASTCDCRSCDESTWCSARLCGGASSRSWRRRRRAAWRASSLMPRWRSCNATEQFCDPGMSR